MMRNVIVCGALFVAYNLNVILVANRKIGPIIKRCLKGQPRNEEDCTNVIAHHKNCCFTWAAPSMLKPSRASTLQAYPTQP